MTTGDYICPTESCNSVRFNQRVQQDELVTVDENGEPLHFTVDSLLVKSISCAECGAEITD